MKNTAQAIVSPSFIKEWDDAQFKGMKKAIKKHFFGKTIFDLNYKRHYIPLTFVGLSEWLGLAYTSSSSAALYCICNVTAQFDETYNYEFFAIGEDGKYYAILWDKYENEKYILL